MVLHQSSVITKWNQRTQTALFSCPRFFNKSHKRNNKNYNRSVNNQQHHWWRRAWLHWPKVSVYHFQIATNDCKIIVFSVAGRRLWARLLYVSDCVWCLFVCFFFYTHLAFMYSFYCSGLEIEKKKPTTPQQGALCLNEKPFWINCLKTHTRC